MLDALMLSGWAFLEQRVRCSRALSPSPRQSRAMNKNDQSFAARALEAVAVRRSGVHGQGVFAVRPLRVGQEVGPYTGRRYAAEAVRTEWDDQLACLFGLSDGSMIDGAQGGNATRHINHACEPNVETGGQGLRRCRRSRRRPPKHAKTTADKSATKKV
jgi:SET domain-containing protein